jgi:hypothetical protein
MICKRCQVAGDLVAEARDIHSGEALDIASGHPTPYVVSTKEAVRSVAHLLHGRCKGSGHCDCQHKVDFEGKTISNGR